MHSLSVSDPPMLACGRAASAPPRVIEPFTRSTKGCSGNIPQGTVLHERLVTEHGLTHSRQSAKLYLVAPSPPTRPFAPERTVAPSESMYVEVTTSL